MSGHSKWSQIKRQKGATDQKRGVLFTKLGKAITIAAREGSGDVMANFKLRLAIDTAKSANMPKETQERAIKRGTGELKGGELQELTYEGFGPGGVALIIKVLSDNKNRTASEIKHILAKHNGNLGEPNSVAWQFQEKGVLRITNTNEKSQDIELNAIDLGAEDVFDEGNDIVIYTNKINLKKVKEGLEQDIINIDYAEMELVPHSKIHVDEKTKTQLKKLFIDLDASLDIYDYYHNTKL